MKDQAVKKNPYEVKTYYEAPAMDGRQQVCLYFAASRWPASCYTSRYAAFTDSLTCADAPCSSRPFAAMRGIVVDWVLTQSNLFLRAFAGNTSRAALAKNNAVMVDYNHPGRRISTKSRDVGKKTWRCILGPDEEPDYVPILIAVAAVAAVVIAAILTDGAVLVPLIP